VFFSNRNFVHYLFHFVVIHSSGKGFFERLGRAGEGVCCTLSVVWPMVMMGEMGNYLDALTFDVEIELKGNRRKEKIDLFTTFRNLTPRN
jgi:hypothetical protein